MILSVCQEKVYVFSTMNINEDNRYCDVRGNIFYFFNKFLHENLFPHPSIILIAFFCVLKVVELCDESPQNIIP